MVNWFLLALGGMGAKYQGSRTYQAVDLVCHRRGEDGHALVPVDRLGKVVVLLGIVDPLESHTNYNMVVSNLQRS